jgi:superfamily II DNA or RNA helicase
LSPASAFLRKALRLPRVNLFIADDTGLGKTIEAGLIARELLLRKRARTVVVAAPASVMEQWKAEMEERFGLLFVILDRTYLAQVRRERGFGVNPWRTHSRFIVSHNLLIDSNYADPMREWLGELSPGSLLILDEAHHAAPSSGGRYGIETKFTRAIRDLGGRFEHRLFLSATPHNGHSNSFATLLELLDPYRFTRGVPVRGKGALEHVMVRRIKEDIREVQGGFPRREVCRVVIDGLPDDAPELVLSRLLDEYRSVRETRFKDVPARTRAAAGLLVVGLQQKLLSSIEAFAISLARHRRTAREQWERFSSADRHAESPGSDAFAYIAASRFAAPPDADDERAEQTDEENASEEAAQIEAANAATESASDRSQYAEALWLTEQELLDRMEQVASAARGHPDAKTCELIRWINEHLCPDRPRWNDHRVLIFTENVIGTKRYLREMLEQAIAGTELADERIATIDGQTAGANRKETQRRFNADPARDPLRILIATDAAREGLNFQAHCTDLFHFDLPWNPGRIEQRNGRIDRKLQPAPEVRCHYFALPQRAEDRVLEVLVRKTQTIKRELGSLSKVIDDDIERRLRGGIRHRDAKRLASEIEAADLDREKKRVAAEELEAARDRQEDLKEQVERCRGLLARSRRWVDFEPEPFRDAMSCSLELLGAAPLQEERTEDGSPVWTFPPLTGQTLADASWTSTLDTLRVPRARNQKLAAWRREAPIRPVVFEDAGVLTDATVHLHLEQRMAQRLLARFRAQGFVHHDLSRSCLVQAADSIPRVILLGRLCLYGRRAERLHEILTPVAARWIEPSRRTGPLRAYAGEAEARTLERLESALQHAHTPSETIHRRLLETASQDITDLLPQLEERAERVARSASDTLRDRGKSEAEQLRTTLERQRKRVEAELVKHEAAEAQLRLEFSDEEKRQRQADVAAWRRRMTHFDRDLKTEPSRIRQFYEVRARRIEPVGLVYLWPDTG